MLRANHAPIGRPDAIYSLAGANEPVLRAIFSFSLFDLLAIGYSRGRGN